MIINRASTIVSRQMPLLKTGLMARKYNGSSFCFYSIVHSGERGKEGTRESET